MLESHLTEYANKLNTRLIEALGDGAELVRARAAERAPDAPPFGKGLVEAIHVDDSQAPFLEYAVVAGDHKVFWGHLVELGTSHSAPHPFLVPALEESRVEILSTLKAAIGHV